MKKHWKLKRINEYEQDVMGYFTKDFPEGTHIITIHDANYNDAYLIATAPELLNACKLLFKIYVKNLGKSSLTFKQEEIIRKAIAKAEGKE